MSSDLSRVYDLIRQKEISKATLLLAKILSVDQDDADAWFVLSELTESPRQKITFLRKVLSIDPELKEAQQRIASLNSTTPSSEPEYDEPASGTSDRLSVNTHQIDLPDAEPERTSFFHQDQAPTASDEHTLPRLMTKFGYKRSRSDVPDEEVWVPTTASPNYEQRENLNGELTKIGYLFVRTVETKNGDYALWHKDKKSIQIHYPVKHARKGLSLDRLVNGWLDYLDYTEQTIVKCRYGLNGRAFTIEATGRIVSLPTTKARRKLKSALEKLGAERSRKIIRPFGSFLVVSLKNAGGELTEEAMEAEIQHGMEVNEVRPLGACRLALEFEDLVQWNAPKSCWQYIERDDAGVGSKKETKDVTSSKRGRSGKRPKPVSASREVGGEVDSREQVTDKAQTIRSARAAKHFRKQLVKLSPETLARYRSDATHIENLHLSQRVYHALRRAAVHTIGELVSNWPGNIWTIKNIGELAINEIEAKLNEYISNHEPVESEPIADTAVPDQVESPEQSGAPRLRQHMLVVELDEAAENLSAILDIEQNVKAALAKSGIVTSIDLLSSHLFECVCIEDITTEDWLSVFDFINRNYQTRIQQVRMLPQQSQSIDELSAFGLSRRTANCFARVGITNSQQVAWLTLADLISRKGIGPKAAREVFVALRDDLDAMRILVGITSNRAYKNIPPSIEARLLRVGVEVISELKDVTAEDLIVKAGLENSELILVERILNEHNLNLSERFPEYPITDPNDYAFLVNARIPIHDISISRLVLPQSVENKLLELDIGTVDKLAASSKAVLEKAFGRNARAWIQLLEISLSKYLAWLPTQHDYLDETSDRGISPMHMMRLSDITLEQLVESKLGRLTDDKYMSIMRLRYGLDGGGVKTLQQVGEKIGLTRARVHQLQNKALASLRETADLGPAMSFYLLAEDYILVSGGVRTTDQIGEYASRMIEPGEIDVPGALRLLLTLKPDEFVEVTRGRKWGLPSTPLGHLVPLSQVLIDTLKQVHAPLREEELVRRVQTSSWYLDNELTESVSAKLIVCCLSTDDRFVLNKDHGWTLARWEKTITDEIVLALREIGKPAHYSEIARVTNKLLPPSNQTSVNNVHGRLNYKSGLFVWVGRGEYGLAEWGLEKPRFYVDIAEEILANNNNPMTAEDIFRRVNSEREASQDSITLMLHTNPRFRRLPDGTFGLPKWLEAGAKGGSSAIDDHFTDELRSRFVDALFDEE